MIGKWSAGGWSVWSAGIRTETDEAITRLFAKTEEADRKVVNACPAGVPWVPDGYANAKFVPAHCQGEPAK